MNRGKLDHAIDEARRFIAAAVDYKEALRKDGAAVEQRRKADPDGYHYAQHFPAKSGSVRRASMDLTRSLADLRRPTQ